METARKYPERVPIRSVDSADAPIGFTSRLRQKHIPDDIRRRVDDIQTIHRRRMEETASRARG